VLIFSRSNCIIAVSGIVTLCKRMFSTLVERGKSLLSADVMYSRFHGVTIRDAVIIQFDLLKRSTVLLETFRGL